MLTTVLLVEDESPIRDMVRFALSREGLDMMEAGDCSEADLCLGKRIPDLILLDWMLPDMSGIEWLRRLRKDDRTAEIPVIMLTARAEEDDKVRGLEAGADDYITKPFSPKELLARIRAVLRRSVGQDTEGLLHNGELSLDPRSHRVLIEGESVKMGPTEFRLLHFFMSHPDRVYSRSQLLDHVWGLGTYVEERTVDVHIRRLRKALSPQGCDNMIQTVRGAGYLFSSSQQLRRAAD